MHYIKRNQTHSPGPMERHKVQNSPNFPLVSDSGSLEFPLYLFYPSFGIIYVGNAVNRNQVFQQFFLSFLFLFFLLCFFSASSSLHPPFHGYSQGIIMLEYFARCRQQVLDNRDSQNVWQKIPMYLSAHTNSRPLFSGCLLPDTSTSE